MNVVQRPTYLLLIAALACAVPVGMARTQTIAPDAPKDSISQMREMENYRLTIEDVRKFVRANVNLERVAKAHAEIGDARVVPMGAIDPQIARIEGNPLLRSAVQNAGLTPYQYGTLAVIISITSMMQMDTNSEHAKGEMRKAHMNPDNLTFMMQHDAEIQAITAEEERNAAASGTGAPRLVEGDQSRGAQQPTPTRGLRPLSPEVQAAYDLLGPDDASRFEQVSGWFRDRPVRYYNFGDVRQPVTPGRVFWPIYGFDASGNPVAIRGQRPIFSTIPGVNGYSGIWRLIYVVTADHVQPNQLRDPAAIDALVRRHRALLRDADTFVNLPIVPRGSVLANDSTPPMFGWYEGRDVQFFDFGSVQLSPVDMWRFARGADASGAPNIVADQNSVVDSIPVAGTYPDLWQIHFVQVDSAYMANTLKSAAAVRSSGFMVDPVSSVRNLPITMLDGARVPREPSPVTRFADLRSPFPPAPTRIVTP